jgi:hypothetical protein
MPNLPWPESKNGNIFQQQWVQTQVKTGLMWNLVFASILPSLNNNNITTRKLGRRKQTMREMNVGWSKCPLIMPFKTTQSYTNETFSPCIWTDWYKWSPHQIDCIIIILLQSHCSLSSLSLQSNDNLCESNEKIIFIFIPRLGECTTKLRDSQPGRTQFQSLLFGK